MASTPTTSASPSPTGAAPGDELGGRYRLLRKIGQGGSATVFEATDLSLERNVAVKVLHSQLSSDPAFLDRFRNEARAAAALSHPNVMAVYDWGEDESGEIVMPYLVMELLDGGSMRSLLDDGNVLSPSQVIQVGLDACRGLNYAHSEGLVHRDITPANLLFDSEGRLNIADFGLAKALADSGWTEPGKDLVGTARYASPEQAQGMRLAASSDVYSLGLILVEALSGSVPFSADTMLGTLTARVESDVPIPDVSEKLAEVLRAMTQRDPDVRPTSNQAGVGLVKSADGMPRPEPLPLVGLEAEDIEIVDAPDELDVTVMDQPEVTELAGTPIVEPSPHDDDEPVRRWPWLLVSLVALGAIGYFAYGEFSNAALLSQPVPDVVGMTAEDAIAELGDDWILGEKFLRDAEIPAGNIVKTAPEAGQLLEEDQTLDYWISLGRPLVRVPDNDLIGRSRQQAEQTLEAIGLTVGTVEQVNNEDVGAGNVISVSAAALELQTGEPVDLVVSLGPSQREIPAFALDTNVEEYLANFDIAGLAVNRVEEFDNEVPLGVIVSVTPPPGTAVDKGESVTVVISQGPVPIAIPATSGQPLGDVLDALTADGFLAGELLTTDGAPGNARCPVVGTDPPQGTELQPGNVITIFLSDCGDGE